MKSYCIKSAKQKAQCVISVLIESARQKAQAENAKQKTQEEVNKTKSTVPSSPVASDPVSLHAGARVHVIIECGKAGSTLVVKPDPGRGHKCAQQVQAYGVPPVREQGGTEKIHQEAPSVLLYLLLCLKMTLAEAL